MCQGTRSEIPNRRRFIRKGVRYTEPRIELRELRKGRGLTLKQLADGAGISKSFMSDIERGQYDPSLPVFLNILDGLGENTKRLRQLSGLTK